jgi:hypothetical protein
MSSIEVYGGDTIFDDAYPKAPYNFDVPPPQYLLGPIKTILYCVNTQFQALYAAISALAAQVTVQTATGIYLDAHGVLYSTPRLAGESDASYRPRILAAITAGKLTIQAITAAVQAYLNSSTAAGYTAPSVYVYDLQSDPTSCAQDAANGNPIEIFQFVVQITRSISDYSSLSVVPGDPLTLFQAGTNYSQTSDDPNLIPVINRVKAGDTRPIIKTIVNISTS